MLHPFFSNLESTGNVGEICGDRTLSQTFVLTRDRLARISILFGTYARENDSFLSLELRERETQKVLERTCFSASQLEDNKFWDWDLSEPSQIHQGKSYQLIILAPEAKLHNAVTCYFSHKRSEPGFQLEIGGRKTQGILTARLWCEISEEEFLHMARSGEIYDEDYFQRASHSVYTNYNLTTAQSETFREYARLIIEHFRPSRVLEVGCATGPIVRRLQERHVDAHGIDISKWAARNAVARNIICANMTALPYPSATFDLVFGCHSIEHLLYDQLTEAIREQVRVSRKWILHIMPILGSGPYQGPKEAVVEDGFLDFIIEDRSWWINQFERQGCSFRRDIRLTSSEEIWARDYNYCQACFEVQKR